jgi:hypothetical protein
VFDHAAQEFRLRATYGMDDKIIAEIKHRHMHIGDVKSGKARNQRTVKSLILLGSLTSF